MGLLLDIEDGRWQMLFTNITETQSMKAGICGCGCGGKTDLAPETRPRRGWVLGKPKPFLPHHGKHRNVSK
jgi:hypothetical protein